MEHVEYISVLLCCNGNEYKSYIEVPCAQCTPESGWIHPEYSLAGACSVFRFPQFCNGNMCMVLKYGIQIQIQEVFMQLLNKALNTRQTKDIITHGAHQLEIIMGLIITTE